MTHIIGAQICAIQPSDIQSYDNLHNDTQDSDIYHDILSLITLNIETIIKMTVKIMTLSMMLFGGYDLEYWSDCRYTQSRLAEGHGSIFGLTNDLKHIFKHGTFYNTPTAGTQPWGSAPSLARTY
jgi:hypothetical protein